MTKKAYPGIVHVILLQHFPKVSFTHTHTHTHRASSITLSTKSWSPVLMLQQQTMTTWLLLESVSQIATNFTSSLGLVIFSLSHDDYCHFILSPFPQPANPTPTNPQKLGRYLTVICFGVQNHSGRYPDNRVTLIQCWVLIQTTILVENDISKC